MELTYYSFNYNAPAMIRLRPEDGDDMIYNTNYQKFKDKKRYVQDSVIDKDNSVSTNIKTAVRSKRNKITIYQLYHLYLDSIPEYKDRNKRWRDIYLTDMYDKFKEDTAKQNEFQKELQTLELEQILENVGIQRAVL